MWYIVSPYLAHHGVKLQKWGVRRYQNKDGSLTAEGRIHYGVGEKKNLKNKKMTFNDSFKDWGNSRSKNVLYLEDVNISWGEKEAVDEFINQTKKLGKVDVVDLNKYINFNWTLYRNRPGESRENVINRRVKEGKLDKDLVSILDKKVPEWGSLFDSGPFSDSKVLLANGVTTRGEVYKKIGQAISEYGEKKYDSGSKVIVRGVQVFGLHDDDKDFYKNNPSCIVGNKKLKPDSQNEWMNNQNIEQINAKNKESFYKYFDTKRKVKDI